MYAETRPRRLRSKQTPSMELMALTVKTRNGNDARRGGCTHNRVKQLVLVRALNIIAGQTLDDVNRAGRRYSQWQIRAEQQSYGPRHGDAGSDLGTCEARVGFLTAQPVKSMPGFAPGLMCGW